MSGSLKGKKNVGVVDVLVVLSKTLIGYSMDWDVAGIKW